MLLAGIATRQLAKSQTREQDGPRHKRILRLIVALNVPSRSGDFWLMKNLTLWANSKCGRLANAYFRHKNDESSHSAGYELAEHAGIHNRGYYVHRI
jgi:hypothetical protein